MTWYLVTDIVYLQNCYKHKVLSMKKPLGYLMAYNIKEKLLSCS